MLTQFVSAIHLETHRIKRSDINSRTTLRSHWRFTSYSAARLRCSTTVPRYPTAPNGAPENQALLVVSTSNTIAHVRNEIAIVDPTAACSRESFTLKNIDRCASLVDRQFSGFRDERVYICTVSTNNARLEVLYVH